MPRLILLLYRALIFIAVWPLCLAARNHPNFKGTLRQRLAWTLPPVPRGDLVWFHGASLGEVKALACLIAAVKARRPRAVVCLSAMTAAGRQAAAGLDGVDLILPMPFDAGWIMRRMLRHLALWALVIAETEIWPELLLSAADAGVPVVFANARMTARSFESYARFRRLFGAILARARVLAIAPEDAARFAALGAAKAEVLGNLKLDGLRDVDVPRRDRLKAELVPPDARVFVAGSVREGEEGYVVNAIAQARAAVPELIAIVAPRHAESIALIEELCDKAGLKRCRRSSVDTSAGVIIVDTVGELASLYGLAEVAFVGGSLIELGGQNILEAVAWGVPVMHGSSMQNFEWALEVVRPHTITVPADFAPALIGVLGAPGDYAAMAAAARQALQAARGATERYLAAVLSVCKGLAPVD